MAEHDVDLPKAQIKRIIQCKLPVSADNKNFSLNKEALLAFVESAKVFISYISTTAHDICCDSKRQTISADDIIKAMEELEFAELVPQLKEYLETYQKWNKERNQKKAEASKASKKRRTEADKTQEHDQAGIHEVEAQEVQEPVAVEEEAAGDEAMEE